MMWSCNADKQVPDKQAIFFSFTLSFNPIVANVSVVIAMICQDCENTEHIV